MAKKNTTIFIKEIETKIRVNKNDSGDDFICITDISKYANPDRPENPIQNWMRNASTLDFLKEWESMYNDDFNHIEFDGIRIKAGTPAFGMTPTQWVNRTNAIGIYSKRGRYGGTYAHKDIAFEFCSAISPKFKLMIIRDYQRLKKDEAMRLGSVWTIRRELAKANYALLTESIKNNLIPDELISSGKEGIYFASEADLLNNIVFGITSKQFKLDNSDKKGNLRDHASTVDLLILANLEALNSRLIKWDCDQAQRFELLTEAAKDFRKILTKNNAIKRLSDRQDQLLG